MRKSSALVPSDSLELLLDTICNVFGGIILMAILVVIQTQSTVGRIPKPGTEDLERTMEARKVAFECARMENRIRDMAGQEELLRYAKGAVASSSVEKLVDARRRFLDAIVEAEARLDALKAEVDLSAKDAAKLALELSDAERKTAEMRSRMDGLQDMLRRTPDIKMRVRLPHQRPMGATPRYYVVKGDRAYVMGDDIWTGGPHVSGHCRVTPLGGPNRATRVEPMEADGMGYVASSDERQMESFIASLRGTGSAYFFVYGDSQSFSSFQHCKHAVLRRGSNYGVEAYPAREGLTVVPVRSVNSQ